MKKLLLSVFVLSISVLSFSQIVTERPTQSESAVVLPKNSFQIESGMVWQKSGDDVNSPINIAAPLTLFRYGISKYFELRIISGYQNIIQFNNNGLPDISSGFSDMEIGTKVQIINSESSNTQIAFLTHLSIPTGSVGFSNNNYSSVSKIAVSHSIGGHIGIGYNVGYKYYGTGESSLLYSLSFGLNINDKFGIFAEPYGEISEFNTLYASINGGVFYQIRDNFQADFSFGSGINHIMNFYAVGFGWNISRNKE